MPDMDPSHELPPGERPNPLGLLHDLDTVTEELGKVIKEKQEQVAELEEKAGKDVLTGLDNRRAFLEKMQAIRFVPEDQQDLREGDVRHVTLLVLDIDHFKAINDTYGHAVGDIALKAVAEHLRTALPHRAQDIVARYGGEEFMAAYIGAPEDEIIRRKLLAQEEDEHMVYRIKEIPPIKFMVGDEEKELTITVSGGMTCQVAGDSLEEAVKRADRALYESKVSGRNRVTSAADLPPDHHKKPPAAIPPENVG